MSYPPRRLFSFAFYYAWVLLLTVIVFRLDSYNKQLLAFPLFIICSYQYWRHKNNGPAISALFTRYCGLATARLIMRAFNAGPTSEPPTARQRLKTTAVSTIVLSGFTASLYFWHADLNWYVVVGMLVLAVNYVAWVADWNCLQQSAW
ncbi:hypothetical protein HGO37_05265 [Rhizobium sp. CG4]|uniref:hypothetical protein n=1 Tax=Rhizobium sp. CG4 TaxID=2726075 RepID=UPI002033DE01|nr:hypothetical protein [Rhizobium sp. CG4]MCM2454792.1 hypothetical protein [Rhizobium sp. CG4]